MSKPRLTPKQARFVEEYLVDLNATAAADRSGFKQPHVQGARLLANVRVESAVGQALKARSKRTEIKQDRVLQEVGRIAFFDPRRLFDEKGNLKEVKELDSDIAACVSSIEVVRDRVKADDGEVTVTETVKVKFWNKLNAIELAGKHLKMFVEKKEFDVNLMSHEEALKQLDQDG